MALRCQILFIFLLSISNYSYEAHSQPVVFITGGSRNLGLSIVQKYLAEGYRVVVASRSLPPEELQSNPRVMHVSLDMAKPEQVFDAVESVYAKWGQVDVLVHNAAQVVAESTDELSMENLQRAQQINFLSPVELTQKIFRECRQRQHPLKVVYVSSIGAVLPEAGFAAYSSSKAAAEAYMSTLAQEIRHDQSLESLVRVAIVRPALINSSGQYDVDLSAKGKVSNMVGVAQKLRNLSTTTPQDVADVVYKVSKQRSPRLVTNVGWDGKLSAAAVRFLPRNLLHFFKDQTQRFAIQFDQISRCGFPFREMFLLTASAGVVLKAWSKLGQAHEQGDVVLPAVEAIENSSHQ